MYLVGVLVLITIAYVLCSQYMNGLKMKSKYTELKVGINSNLIPYSYEENGKLKGISIDGWNLWSKKMDVKVKFIPIKYSKYDNELSSKDLDKCDVLDLVDLKLSNAFLNNYESKKCLIVDIVACKRKNGYENPIIKIGIKKDEKQKMYINKQNAKYVYYNKYEDMFSDLRKNKIDVFLINKATCLYFFNKYSMNKEFEYYDEHRSYSVDMLIKKDKSELEEVIAYGFSLIGESEYDQIKMKWMGFLETKKYMTRYIKYSVGGSILFAIVFISVIYYLKRKIEKQNIQLEGVKNKLIQTNEEYKEIIENLNVAVSVYDSAGRVILCNNKFRHFFLIDTQGAIDIWQLNQSGAIFINKNGKVIETEDCPVVTSIKNKKPVVDVIIGVKKVKDEDILWLTIDAIPELDSNNNITRIITTYVNITERVIFEKKLKKMSIFDELTGVYNRNYFEKQIKRYEDNKVKNIGVMMCDLDGLKLVNDSLGHAYGDRYIVEISNVLKLCCDKNELISRTGGDEFTILVQDADAKKMKELKYKIVDKTNLLNSSSDKINFSLSIGFSIYYDNSKCINDVCKEADDLMYREKIHNHVSVKRKNLDLIIGMLKERDFVTEGHCDRMINVVAKLSSRIGMDNDEIKNMKLFAQFHDIGKVGVPDSVLLKEGKLTFEEVEIIKKHSEIGFRIAKSSPELSYIADWILKHHERFDGSGYPLGISGYEIPIECRILAIVDAFDAMTNNRPYRKSISENEAMRELIINKGTQFDPELVDEFNKLYLQRVVKKSVR